MRDTRKAKGSRKLSSICKGIANTSCRKRRRDPLPHQINYGRLVLICIVIIVVYGLASYLPWPWNVE